MHDPSTSSRVSRQRRRRQGQTLVEYSLILAVVVIVSIGVISALGSRVLVIFSSITSLLDTAQSP